MNELMLLLVRHGYLEASSLNTAQTFSPAVEASVRRFQQDNNLPTDGVVGPLAIVYLRRLSAVPAGSLGSRVLSAGMNGPDVNALMLILVRHNYLGAADLNTQQLFTPAVEAAVRRFQGARGLPADGVVGPTVASSLAQLDEGR